MGKFIGYGMTELVSVLVGHEADVSNAFVKL